MEQHTENRPLPTEAHAAAKLPQENPIPPEEQRPETDTVLPEELPDRERKKQESCRWFRILGIPALIYAAVTAFLLYHHFSGIAMTAESAAAAVFAVSAVKRTGVRPCRGSRLILTAILLLGLSDFLTGNAVIQFYNGLGIFVLLLLFLVLNFRRPAGDRFRESLSELLLAPFRGLARLDSPFKDTSAYIQTEPAGWKKRIIPILAGLVCGLPLILLILILLSSADTVFRKLIEDLLTGFSWEPFGIFFSFLLWFVAVYSILRALQAPKTADRPRGNEADRVTGITVCIPVSLIYLVFSVIQILFLFLRKMELPAGCSYADYVHEGYFQLMAACLINLFLVIFAKEFFRKSRLLDLLLTVICGCTYIMAASSALRMIMYIRAYGLTFLRVLVLWTLAAAAVLLAGLLIRIRNEHFFLFRYLMITVFSAWILFSYTQPDRLIASYNLYSLSGAETDFRYLSTLSTDAAPVLFQYAENSGCCDPESPPEACRDWFYAYKLEIGRKRSWREFTLSGLRARGYLQDEQGLQPEAPVDAM